MTISYLKVGVKVLACVLPLAGCTPVNVQAEAVPAAWKTECVGRSSLSLPGPVQVAMTKRDAFTVTSGQTSIVFPDGSYSLHAGSVFDDATLDITPSTSAVDFKKLRDEVNAAKKQHKQERMETGDTAIANATVPYELGAPNAFAWRGIASVDVFLHLGDHLFRYDARRSFPESERRAK